MVQNTAETFNRLGAAQQRYGRQTTDRQQQADRFATI